MPALHSSLRSSLKNQIGLVSFLSDERWMMSDPLGMFVPLVRFCIRRDSESETSQEAFTF
jgi:hypothetical protein